jgi:peptide subunit release factor 1 (eRF1)
LPHPNRGLIKEKSAEIIDEYEKSNEEKVVNDLVSSIGGKGWEAVMGIDSVLENFYLRKIKMFIIGSNYEKLGFVCGHCHHVSLLPGDCLSCGGKTAKVSDLADEIIEEAIKNKIKIKQLLYEHKKFDKFGIGAFLRDY